MMNVDTGLNPQVFELFIVFSRLEYALTRSDGFARGSDGGPVEGDWRKLAKCLGQTFFDQQRADPAKKKLWLEPPGRWNASVDQDGKVTPVWHGRTAPTELHLLYEPIVWVRNCVIHGESQDMVLRYKESVGAAVAVLHATVEECAGRDDLQQIADFFTRSRIQEE